MKPTTVLLMMFVFMICFAVVSTGFYDQVEIPTEVDTVNVQQAGILGSLKKVALGSIFDVIALAVSAVVGVVALKFGFLYSKFTKTLKETGEFMNTLGTALEDKQVTREEVAAIVKEGTDVFKVWT